MGRGRPIKQGLDYYPLDTDMFRDLKIRKLIKYQGGKSIAVYIDILCNIYREGYYLVWDKDTAFCIAEETGFTDEYVEQVLNCCLTLDIFDLELFNSDRVVTSKGVQLRFVNICKLSKRAVSLSEFAIPEVLKLIYSEEIRFNSEEIRFNSEENRINSELSTQRKVKKIKEISTDVDTKKVACAPTSSAATAAKKYEAQILLYPVEEITGRLFAGGSQWEESAAISLGISPERLRGLGAEFLNHLKSQLETEKTESDYCRHFLSWARIKIKNISDGKTITGNRQGDSIVSRRREQFAARLQNITSGSERGKIPDKWDGLDEVQI